MLPDRRCPSPCGYLCALLLLEALLFEQGFSKERRPNIPTSPQKPIDADWNYGRGHGEKEDIAKGCAPRTKASGTRTRTGFQSSSSSMSRVRRVTSRKKKSRTEPGVKVTRALGWRPGMYWIQPQRRRSLMLFGPRSHLPALRRATTA